MKSTPRVPGDIPLMAIGYKYIYQKVLEFIARGGGTVPGVPYLSRYPDDYSNVSILPVLRPHLLGGYFSANNTIDNHDRMRQSGIALEKYWVTQSGNFILANYSGIG